VAIIQLAYFADDKAVPHPLEPHNQQPCEADAQPEGHARPPAAALLGVSSWEVAAQHRKATCLLLRVHGLRCMPPSLKLLLADERVAKVSCVCSKEARKLRSTSSPGFSWVAAQLSWSARMCVALG
jgi:hypothetical protein